MTRHTPFPRVLQARALPVAALAGVAALGLSACGPAVGDDSGSDEAAAVDWATVEPADSISFWSNHPGGTMELEQEFIDAFTEETGIEVELVTAGANYEEVSQKFQTAQTSNDIGDMVVVSDATWFSNHVNGSLLPVDEVMEAVGNDVSTYQQTLYDDYLYEDSHYGVPYSRSTTVFYYNKDHFAAAGLDDAVPSDWEGVKAAAQTLMDADIEGQQAAFAFPPADGYPAWVLNNLVWGYGGGWSDEWDMSALTSPETVEAVTFAQTAVQDGWATVSSNSAGDDFAAGAASMYIGSTGSLGGVTDSADFEVGVGLLPGGPVEQDLVVPTGGAGIGISAKSTPEEQLAAAQFMDFVTNAENTAEFSEFTGYMPVRTDSDLSALYEQNPNYEIAVNQLEERSRTQDFGRVLLPGGDHELSQALQEILTTDVDVEERLQASQETMTGLYESDLADTLEN
ncbi:ABC transporter substrate-binding protein [Brevibacterium litoralis]|uniref:ABC transporter substrate-binding protein n=1 Tax=Brevibacterium litoralis TaxID=3138935 RepID=UPI0032EF2F47